MQRQRLSRVWIVLIVAVVVGLMVACTCLPPTSVTQQGKPTVTIIAPANNSQVPVGQPTTIQVSAADAQGVTRIEVKVDGALVSTTQSPSPQGQPTLMATQDWT
ncbi:MAG: Ig-like domain-containing protein, partial [Promethearchaeota archaeon]